MQQFLEEMASLDTKENHLKIIDNLLLVYLTSQEANDQSDRCQTLMLGIKLRNLFVWLHKRCPATAFFSIFKAASTY